MIRIQRLGSLFASPAGRFAAAVSVIMLGREGIKAIIAEQSDEFDAGQKRLAALGSELHRASVLHKDMGRRLEERTAELADLDARIMSASKYSADYAAECPDSAG